MCIMMWLKETYHWSKSTDHRSKIFYIKMSKTVPDIDNRRKDLLDCAEKFFFEKGYEQTSVNDIVNSIDVSKGTFYYYFTSKEEILDEILKRIVISIKDELLDVLDESGRDAIAKTNLFFKISRGWKVSEIDAVTKRINILNRPENSIIVNNLKEMQVEILSPILARIIKFGVDEGVFDSVIPMDCARLLIRLGNDFTAIISRMLLCLKISEITLKDIERQIEQYQTAIEKITGAPPETVRIINQRFIRDIGARL